MNARNLVLPRYPAVQEIKYRYLDCSTACETFFEVHLSSSMKEMIRDEHSHTVETPVALIHRVIRSRWL